MDVKGILNQLLASGSAAANPAQGGSAGQVSGMSDMTKGALGGAVGGSLLTMLLGSKKGRKMGTKVAKVGGTAALGVLAYKVYNDWKSSQQPQAQAASSGSPSMVVAPPDTPQHSMTVLRAMLAAAKADGHVDEGEQARIYKAVQSMGASREVSAFVDAELSKPLDPADVARGIDCPEEAAEVYLASLLMVDEQSFMERAYLQELARELKLAPELVSRLEAQV
ncbi:tellurite resistance TerB family protein [Parahaliea aestuarii]|uniref:Tellurite resistance TerB family protein n=1 Tax=Parahaliea aestuarii TaxID=1852021 RepID=A0A5C9A1W3_9GAMM|nr:tellurite resistance TerB family protein [Parahaliea aestuarii]TXS94706.1 tellurite resistance TerB family protein [Parahaliea aestuarii]